MKIILSLLLLLFLPGYLIIRASKKGVPPSRSLARRAWLQGLVASIVAASWAGLALAEYGSFSLNALLLTLGVFCVVLFLVFRPALRGGTSARGTSPARAWPLFIILCVFAFLCLYYGPSEYVFGGWDSGEYVNMGALIAERGRIVYRDDFFASLPDAARGIFTQGPRRYMGFNLAGENRSLVSPKFMHLYPLWLAVAMNLGGLRYALSLNIFFALVSIALCYQIALRLGGRGAAFAAAALMASSAAGIWFARSQCAEPLAQLFFLGAVYFWVIWQQGENRIAAPLSAACLGMMFLTKFDSLLVLPLLAVALLLTKRKDGERLFLLVLFLSLLQFAIHSLWWGRPYVRAVFNNIVGTVAPGTIFAAAAGGAIAFAVFAVFRMRGRGFSLDKLGPGVRLILGAALMTSAVLIYFVRPVLSASLEAANLVEFSWFVGVGLFWFAVAAFIWLWLRGVRDEEKLLWFSALGVTALFSFTLIGEHHLYPWSARRFFPVTLPAIALLSGLLAGELFRMLPRKAGITLFIGLAILAVTPIINYPFLITARDYPGGAASIRKLCEATGDFDIVICEQVTYAVPLDFICRRNVLLFKESEQTVDKCNRVEELISSWLEAGKRVAYVTAGPAVHGKTIAFRPAGEVVFRTTLVPLKRHAMPTGEAEVTSRIKVLKALPLEEYTPEEDVRFDIHYNCFGLEEGFCRPRRIGRRGGVGRWTRPSASLIIPWFDDGSASELVFSLSTGPRGGAKVPVEVFIEGEKITDIVARGGLSEYGVVIPPGTAKCRRRVRLGLRTEAWDPAEAGLSGYHSSLGVFLDSITIKRKKQDSRR